jgi:predicted transcriptional regulator
MGLHENIDRDPISDIELREVIAVKRQATVREAAQQMKKHRLGCAIVVDRYNKPIGKFTERKLMRLLLDNPANLDQPVEKFMYATADAIPRTEPIAKMIEVMQTRSLRFLCVTDEKGKAVGLTGQKGLMEYIAEHFPRSVKVQQLNQALYTKEREGA